MFTSYLFRSFCGVPLGLWIILTVVYYWWLLSNIVVLHNKFKTINNKKSLGNVARNIHNNSDVCETIHISILLTGQRARQSTAMLKSLLHQRQNPIHFHLLVNHVSEGTVRTLFDTWDLPEVNYTCYNVDGIPKTAIATLLPNILPNNLKKVIYLETDLIIRCDVVELWNMFKNMRNEQFIGLAENQNHWYKYDLSTNDFDTGVILIDLNKIRSKRHATLIWHNTMDEISSQVGNKELEKNGDLIHSIIKEIPNNVYTIDCLYNVQLFGMPNGCYGRNPEHTKITHCKSICSKPFPDFNQNLKYLRDGGVVRDLKYFRNIHQSYVDLDSYALTLKSNRCTVFKVYDAKADKSNLCASIRAMRNRKLRTHIYYTDYSYNSIDNYDVTLVLQLSIDRLHFLERFVKQWRGPISAAIYLSDQDIDYFDIFLKYSEIIRSRTNLAFHLVFKTESFQYPVNYLRNVALENINTPYMFLMDVDFAPMFRLYNYLRIALRVEKPTPENREYLQCFVVPAFETLSTHIPIPQTKRDLVARLAQPRGGIAPFRLLEWPQGHRATNYTRWVHATESYEVEWEVDYEPYLLVHRSVPKYDVRFSGYGWNKATHSMELRSLGYRAVVLPGAFVVHTPHAMTKIKKQFKGNWLIYTCLQQIRNEFVKYLWQRYNVTFDDLKILH